MRRLLLLRHAKAAWSDGVSDADRALAPRGRNAAPRIGRYLAEQSLVPDLVLVSDARRARETWDLVRRTLPERPTRIEPRIYEASTEALLTVLREVEDAAETLLMVGHNPGFATLARTLAKEGDPDGLARLTVKYPTAGLAVLTFPVERWSAVAPGSGRLERFVTPKTLGADADD
jgi:phosphohistidine phosphatase